MYLIIYKNGDIEKINLISEKLMQAFDAEYVNIIDISLHKEPKELIEGNWVNIKETNNE